MNNRLIKVVTITTLLIFATSIAIIFFAQSKSQYPDNQKIVNLSEYTKGKPTDKETVEYIEYDLFRMINLNSSKKYESNEIKDIFIRKDTFSQFYDKDTDVHTVHFILDIKSIKQSYNVSYQWTSDHHRSEDIDEYGTGVKCLPKERLIYGDFNCKDMFTEEEDPFADILPFSTMEYTIRQSPSADNTLNITINTSAADERIDPDGAIESYKQQATQYLLDNNVDLEKYKLNYKIIHASLY